MSESLAFLRLVWSRDVRLALAIILASLVGALISYVAANVLPSERLSFMPSASLRDIAVFGTMLLTVVPASFAALGLFNFQLNEEHLESPQSCCSHWLLRMPIKSWKIAIVPVVLKTVWMSTCWLLLIVPIQALAGSGGIPWFEPALSLSAIAIGYLAISWRPFRSGWWRVGAMIAMGLASLNLMVLAQIRTQIELQPWHALGTTGVVLAYAGTVWLLLHSVRLARTETAGIIPAGKRFVSNVVNTGNVSSKQIELRNPIRALAWHDLYRAKKLSIIAIGLMFIPLLIFAGCVGLQGGTIFIAMIASAICSWSVLTGSMYPMNWKSGAVLPTYLIASPIPSYRIAWTRLVTSFAIQIPFIVVSVIAILLWTLSRANRSQWTDWAESLAASIGITEPGNSEDVFWFGIRMSAAIILASVIAMHGRIVSLLWVNMHGRDWLVWLVGALVLAAILTGVIVPLSWFFRYESIEEVREVAMWWASFAPLIIGLLLTTKIAFALAAGGILIRKDLAPMSAITRILMIWCVFIASFGILFHLLIPDARATIPMMFATSALCIPLGSVYWMPISVDADRHR